MFSAGSSSSAHIRNIPTSSLVDEKLHAVSVTNLKPNQPVTLHLNVTNGLNINCDSINVLPSDDKGTVDLDSAKPVQLAGLTRSYHQHLDSMGIFRSLVPRDGWDYRFWSADVRKPLSCTLSVYEGMLTSVQETKSCSPLATAAFKRCYLGKGVTRQEVKSGKVRGTLFLPDKTDKKRPCIITLHGGIKKGRLCEDIASLLASRGFPSLALGYFGIEGLPKNLYAQPMDMAYFEEALKFVTGLPETDSSGVGLWGISKGGELCLSICAFFPEQVKGLVIANSMIKVFGHEVIYKDYKIEPYEMSITSKLVGHNLFSMTGTDKEILNSGEDASSIPFWNTDAPILYVAGGDDVCIDSKMHGQRALDCLTARGKEKNFQMSYQPKMGHLVDLPYSSVATSDTNPGLGNKEYKLWYGGEDFEQHSLGQENVWRDTLNFYERNL